MSPTAPKRTAASRTQATAGRVDIDLDELDIKPDPPLVFRKNGVKIRLINVRDLDWQVTAALQESTPADMFATIVVAEDYEKFLALKISDKELTEVARLYNQHFGALLGDPGESDA